MHQYDYEYTKPMNNTLLPTAITSSEPVSPRYFASLKQEILKHEFISFDLFDTLVLRPYSSPWHLDMHIEKKLSIPDFYALRTAAEDRAYEEIVYTGIAEEVTTEQIYERMPAQLHKVMAEELADELKVSLPRTCFQEIWNFALENNKKIIVLTDIYFSEELVKQILHKHGYDNWDLLLVSSESGIGKRTGNLYRKMLTYLGIGNTPEKVLHIGDYLKSDVFMAKKEGLDVFPCQRMITGFLEKHPLLKEPAMTSLTVSVMTMFTAVLTERGIICSKDDLYGAAQAAPQRIAASGYLNYIPENGRQLFDQSMTMILADIPDRYIKGARAFTDLLKEAFYDMPSPFNEKDLNTWLNLNLQN